MKRKNLGLYIHIPFCEKKCDYCNFVSFCGKDEQKKEYVDLLVKEIEIQGKTHKNYVVDSVFVGGGTPSCLELGEIKKIFDAINDNFLVTNDAEITIECNPNSLNKQKLLEYKSCGINRLSIGLQAYNNKLLKLIGRLHTKKDFDKAYKLAREVGFKNISADIILGLPKQKIFDVKHELKHLIGLGVEHISAYGLIVEDSTKLAQNLNNKKYKLPSEEKQVKMYDKTKKILQKNGYFRYEVSNFAKPQFESLHNQKYWNGSEYLGLGLVSSSFENGTRWKNTDVFAEYKTAISSGKIPMQEVEILDKNDRIEECIMLSLRTSFGIDLNKLKNQFGYDLLREKAQQIESLKQNGLIDFNKNQLFATDLGFKLLNQIILELVWLILSNFFYATKKKEKYFIVVF